MISSEVQRTLVKSPPELWAELSDPALLARHLGELGEIRITRVEPEQTVEWEAENTSGTVQIKPSGWGTRVTLTVTRELPEEEAGEAGAPSVSEPPDKIDCDPPWPAQGHASFVPASPPAEPAQEAAAEMQPEVVEAEPEPLADDALQPHSYVWLIDDEPEPRHGFFARLFRRRRTPRVIEPEAIESPGEMDPVSELAEEIAPAAESWQPDASREPFLDPAPADDARAPAQVDQPAAAPPEPALAPDMSSELKAAQEAAPEEGPTAEEAATAEVTALLTSVLDCLGAAHHRPFSRS
jgi:hypothetical protein